mmetsp:Transcript_31858/g.90487  ORF Transcript_31858/g.90487 Transcript_31858/m.90487 type:complete len:148 (-) Transcript_31858:105-548(-)|eukprot:CAMPEP_0117649766 /NCGR_PEP_ID=MMETSP0804-20121206/1168_1 /TAXON_ID=1074897 /ORGANISM="Tetraselmis astigmatica, Strain CCMP880" /LENGTH=147 /DNA_ID=CAMNT_0005455567 /DNA_START=86 /DNA_END=529 /DNA_ORIENTATION=+
MAALATAFSGMTLGGSVAARRGQTLSVSAGTAAPSGRVSFFVHAKQNSDKRQRVSEKARLYNKDKKSAIATRIKKVLKTADTLQKSEIAEADILSLETLISEATKAIDKGVSQGVLQPNTANRRKSRLSRVKRGLLIQAGMYTPAAQ